MDLVYEKLCAAGVSETMFIMLATWHFIFVDVFFCSWTVGTIIEDSLVSFSIIAFDYRKHTHIDTRKRDKGIVNYRR